MREEAVTLVGRSVDPCPEEPAADEAGVGEDRVFEPDPRAPPALEAPAPDAVRVDAARVEVALRSAADPFRAASSDSVDIGRAFVPPVTLAPDPAASDAADRDPARCDAAPFVVLEAEVSPREDVRPVARVDLPDDVVAGVARRAPLADVFALEASLFEGFDRGSGSTSVAGSFSIHGPTS